MSRSLTHRFWLCGAIGFGSLIASLAIGALEPAALGAPFLVVLLLSLYDGWWQPVRAEMASVSSPRVIE